jgi:cell shape-determining protein MreD
VSPFQEVKWWLILNLGLAKDALHVYVGLTVMFGSALLFGWRLSSWRPWLAVLIAALAGEAWDIRDRWVIGFPQEWSGNWHDLWNTLFWPSVFLLLARRTWLFGR